MRQLDAVAARLLVNLARHTPLLPDAGQLTYLDIDDTVGRTYGYAKQGAGCGYTGVKGLNALLAIISHADHGAGDRRDQAPEGIDDLRPRARPGWSPTRCSPRAAGAGSDRGSGAVRADSAYYCSDVVAAVPGTGPDSRSPPAKDPAVQRGDRQRSTTDAWTAINYPNAICDEAPQQWISDAEVAEAPIHRVHVRRPSASR